MGRPLKVDWQHSADTLRERYLNETDHQDCTRLHALWLTRRGRPMSEVADLIGVCYESVRRWVDWYRSGGVEEVLSRRHGGSGGRKPRLSEEDREKLVRKAERGELRTIADGVRWAREEAEVEYTYWGMRHVFQRLDLKKKVPRQQSPEADPEQQEAWKKGG
jgi:transposase